MKDVQAGIKQITLSGRFDADGVSEINAQFMAAVEPKQHLVIVEMSNVTFMASTGIRLLLSGAKSLKSAGGKLVIAAPKQEVEYPLMISKVDTVIPIYKTVDQAQLAGY